MSTIVLGGTTPPLYHALDEALVIKGDIPFGPAPGTPDNRMFLDELEQFSRQDQKRLLDQYQHDGYVSITLGPAVANGYDGQYPPTSWVTNPAPIFWTLRECRRRGLRVTLVVMPDCEPYFDRHAQVWNWSLVERDLTPLYTKISQGGLAQNIQVEWEVACSNAEACKATAYCRRLFPTSIAPDIYWHTWPGHSAPGYSWEPLLESTMWHNFVHAGGTGWAVQDDAIWHDSWTEDEMYAAFVENSKDALRHCNGYNGWPILQCWNREYRAYRIYHDNWSVTGSPRDWGETSRALGIRSTGDGGPVQLF